MDEFDSRIKEAPFNMAIATLKRLDVILQQIRMMDILFPRDSPDKQKSYINLVKQFYINAVPLLKEEEVKQYEKEILSMNIKKQTGIKSHAQVCNYVYDSDMDIRLNEILIELQQKLKKFFMPEGKDPSSAVSRF